MCEFSLASISLLASHKIKASQWNSTVAGELVGPFYALKSQDVPQSLCSYSVPRSHGICISLPWLSFSPVIQMCFYETVYSKTWMQARVNPGRDFPKSNLLVSVLDNLNKIYLSKDRDLSPHTHGRKHKTVGMGFQRSRHLCFLSFIQWYNTVSHIKTNTNWSGRVIWVVSFSLHLALAWLFVLKNGVTSSKLRQVQTYLAQVHYQYWLKMTWFDFANFVL